MMMKDVPAVAGFVALIFGVALTLCYLAFGCTPAAGPAEAGAGYAAQQLACVDEYRDRHNIDACRAKVRAAWGIDAGPEGGW